MFLEWCMFHIWATFLLCLDYGRSTSLQSVSSRSNKGVCETEECHRIANLFNSNMNSNVNPCENFYEFACGNYSHRVRRVGLGSFSEIRKVTLKQLRNIMEGASNVDIEPLQKARRFYKSCIHDETYKMIGVKNVRAKILKLGIWPITDANEDISWIDTIHRSRNLGFFPDYIMSVTVAFNPRNKTEILLALGPPTLSLPTAILQKDTIDSTVGKYKKFLMLIALEFQALSMDPTWNSTINERLIEVEKLFYFEVQLAKISPIELDTPEHLLNAEILNLKTAGNRYPTIDLKRFLQGLIGPEVVIGNAEKIGVLWPKFMSKLNYLLEVTPKSFADVIGPKYVQTYFREESKRRIQEMVNRIKNEMKKSLSNSVWIDNETKEHALNKLKAITAIVGYADDIMNHQKDIKKAYENLQISSTHYYESFLNLSKFNNDNEFAILRRTPRQRKIAVKINPTSINAFYIPNENTMVIPAAILQSLFYSDDRPNYLNYGTIGFIAGHELTHAFDNHGRQFDEDGNYRNWWQSETKVRYQDRVKCFIDQYNSYRSHEVNENVNGVLTLGENIADNEGIRTAYRAYTSWKLKHGEEKSLPGLHDYTPEQLFWLGAANIWCGKYSKAYLNWTVSTDNHAPAMFRVNGQMANQKEFAADFSCPIGSQMNPRKKCSFW